MSKASIAEVSAITATSGTALVVSATQATAKACFNFAGAVTSRARAAMRRAKVTDNEMESRIKTTTPSNSALCAPLTRLAKLAARSSKKTAAAAATRGASAAASFHKPGENSGRLRKNSVFANSVRWRAMIATSVCRASICRERARLSVASMSSYSLRCSVHSALTTAVTELATFGSAGFTLGGVAPWVAAEETFASVFAGAALPGISASAGLTAGCAAAGAAGAGAAASDFASGDGVPNCSSRASIACKRGVRWSITFCRSSGSGSTRSRSRRNSPSLAPACTSAVPTSSNVARARSSVLLSLSNRTNVSGLPIAAGNRIAM